MRGLWFKWIFRLWPCIRGTGVKVTYVANDFSKITAKLPLNFRTRNYVGTIFGGSLYAAADPFYMLMLIKRLGEEYVVWDIAGEVQFIKAGRETLYSEFLISDQEIFEIKELLQKEKKLTRIYTSEWVSESGTLHAKVTKKVYIRKSSNG